MSMRWEEALRIYGAGEGSAQSGEMRKHTATSAYHPPTSQSNACRDLDDEGF